MKQYRPDPIASLLIVSPASKAGNGDYVVAKTSEEEATFRQHKRYDNTRILHPLNSRYEDIVLNKTRAYRIVAVLAEMRRTYK